MVSDQLTLPQVKKRKKFLRHRCFALSWVLHSTFQSKKAFLNKKKEEISTRNESKKVPLKWRHTAKADYFTSFFLRFLFRYFQRNRLCFHEENSLTKGGSRIYDFKLKLKTSSKDRINNKTYVSSMIPLARPTVPPVANIIFMWNLFCYTRAYLRKLWYYFWPWLWVDLVDQ